MRLCGKMLTLFILAALLLPVSATAATVREVDFKGESALEMANGLVTAIIVPSLSGRIAVLQDVKGSNLMKDYEFRNSMPFWKSGNLAGYNDFFLQEGIRSGEYAYNYAVKETGKSSAVVEVSLETADKTVLRRMTLQDGSRVLDIETSVTSRKSAPTDWNYWVNMLVTPGGRMLGSGHTAFVPAASGKAADSGSANGSAIEMLIEAGYSLQDKANISSDTLMEGAPGNSVSFNFRPVQPWRAVVDGQTLEGIGNLLDPAETDGMVTYFCSSGEDSTMEVIFPKHTYKPGDTASFHLGLAVLKGMERIDWMGADMAVACRGPRLQTPDKESGLLFRVLTLRSGKDMKLSLRLRSVEKAAVFGPWTASLRGNAAAPEDVSVKVPFNSLPAGMYELLIGGDDKAPLILGRLVKITQ